MNFLLLYLILVFTCSFLCNITVILMTQLKKWSAMKEYNARQRILIYLLILISHFSCKITTHRVENILNKLKSQTFVKLFVKLRFLLRLIFFLIWFADWAELFYFGILISIKNLLAFKANRSGLLFFLVTKVFFFLLSLSLFYQ